MRLDLRARLTLSNGWEVTGYVPNLADGYDYSQIVRPLARTADPIHVIPSSRAP
ncbi:MAG: hypothetical protein ACREVI_13320 [Steroidobacteraceae bacterium]